MSYQVAFFRHLPKDEEPREISELSKKIIHPMREGFCSATHRCGFEVLPFQEYDTPVRLNYTNMLNGVYLTSETSEKYLCNLGDIIAGEYQNPNQIPNAVCFKLPNGQLVPEAKPDIVKRVDYFLRGGELPAHLKDYLQDEPILPDLLNNLKKDTAIPVITYGLVIFYSMCRILLNTTYKDLVPCMHPTDIPEGGVFVLNLNTRDLNSVNGITIIPFKNERFDYLEMLKERKYTIKYRGKIIKPSEFLLSKHRQKQI